MTLVVLLGTADDSRTGSAAEWATRYLAAGFDVASPDAATLAPLVAGHWPAADRLGLFDAASPERLRATADGDLDAADLVHVLSGDAPASARLVATATTVRGCSPAHLLPVVHVSGPHAERLAAFYLDMGMAPVTDSTPAEEQWRLGEGIARLAGDDPDVILAVMRSLRPSGSGVGAALAHHEARRFGARSTMRWSEGTVVEAPLRLYSTPVEPEWVDYNAHMTEAAYLTAAGWASDALFRYIGDDEAYRDAGHSFYTVETHITYVREVAVHEPIVVETQMLGSDAKRMHFLHTMLHGVDGGMLATVEQMLVHVDMNAGRSAPILPGVAAAVRAITEAHAVLPVPPQVGSVMRLPAPKPSH
jgi:carnitine 3-dehydrogenase